MGIEQVTLSNEPIVIDTDAIKAVLSNGGGWSYVRETIGSPKNGGNYQIYLRGVVLSVVLAEDIVAGEEFRGDTPLGGPLREITIYNGRARGDIALAVTVTDEVILTTLKTIAIELSRLMSVGVVMLKVRQHFSERDLIGFSSVYIW